MREQVLLGCVLYEFEICKGLFLLVFFYPLFPRSFLQLFSPTTREVIRTYSGYKWLTISVAIQTGRRPPPRRAQPPRASVPPPQRFPSCRPRRRSRGLRHHAGRVLRPRGCLTALEAVWIGSPRLSNAYASVLVSGAPLLSYHRRAVYIPSILTADLPTYSLKT